MSDETNNPYEQAAAFQKIWTESMTKVAQASFTYSPDTAPPELMREVRAGIFKALTHSWEEFLRSPEFLEGTSKMMKNAIAFRQMNSEILNRAQHEMQGTNRNDVDTIMLSIRHLESRVLDHLENLSTRLETLETRTNGSPSKPIAKKASVSKKASASKRAPAPKKASKTNKTAGRTQAKTKTTTAQRKKRS